MQNRSNDPTAEIQIQTQQDPEWGGGSASVSLWLPFYKVRETQRKAYATEEIHVPGSALPRPAAPRTRAPRQDLPPITPVLLLRELRLPPRERRAQRAARPGAQVYPQPPHGSRDCPDEAEPRPQQEAGGHGACGLGGSAAAAAGRVRGAAGVPQGQRIHPRALPRRVAHPRRAPQRLRLAQRDPQCLDVRAPSPSPSPPIHSIPRVRPSSFLPCLSV
jgi:hypothetical protein